MSLEGLAPLLIFIFLAIVWMVVETRPSTIHTFEKFMGMKKNGTLPRVESSDGIPYLKLTEEQAKRKARLMLEKKGEKR